MHEPSIIHATNVDHLPASCACNLFGKALIGKSLESGLDDVHLVARARRSSSKVRDSSSTSEFENEMLAAVAEA